MRTAQKLIWTACVMLALAVAGIGATIWYVHWPEIAKIPRPLKSLFTADAVRRGEQLAAVGDCIVCHTAEGGATFAGARALPTPFGTLYSNNITPDEDTGIGNWSQAAFNRAMRKGIGRDGTHLYPALPYEHFTHVSDRDLEAIYAFLMTRQPVRQTAPKNDLLPGLGFRPLLAGWQLLFLHETPFVPNISESDAWNRGKYLVDGLGHCGGCHTPRNIAGGEEGWRNLQGGVAEGWNAPPLDARNPSADTWTEERLFTYLKTGGDPAHSIAAGPMGPVTEGLSRVNDGDVAAIATYISSLMKTRSEPNKEPVVIVDNAAKAEKSFPIGARLFDGACAGCHGASAPMILHDRPALSFVTDLKTEDPNNAIRALFQGIPAPLVDAPLMPAFKDNLDDADMLELLNYIRARFTNEGAWPNLESTIVSTRMELAKP